MQKVFQAFPCEVECAFSPHMSSSHGYLDALDPLCDNVGVVHGDQRHFDPGHIPQFSGPHTCKNTQISPRWPLACILAKQLIPQHDCGWLGKGEESVLFKHYHTIRAWLDPRHFSQLLTQVLQTKCKNHESLAKWNTACPFLEIKLLCPMANTLFLLSDLFNH